MSTRATILNAVARDLGWHTGSITSGTANTAVIDQSFGDDSALAGWTIVMPDAATDADRERLITYWDDSARTITWINARADTTYTSETYFLVPPGDYTRQDIYTAINDCLAHTRQTVRTIIPTIQDERLYRLSPRISNLRSIEDIDGVFYRQSPSLVDNSNFDYWTSGTAAAPTSWVLAGSGGTVVRTTTPVPRGGYGVTVTRVGADTTLTQTVGLLNGQLLGQSIAAACYVRATVASRARIGIYDGVTTTYSSYHTGGSADELLTVSKTLSASSTTLQFIMSVDTGNTSGTFSNFVAVEGTSVDTDLTTTGNSAYTTQYVDHRVRQLGDTLAIELPRSFNRKGQLIVWNAQPYPSLSADSDSSLMPDDALIPGTVYELTSRMQKGQDRTRIEALMKRRREEYLALARPLREYPAVATRGRVVVGGA